MCCLSVYLENSVSQLTARILILRDGALDKFKAAAFLFHIVDMSMRYDKPLYIGVDPLN